MSWTGNIVLEDGSAVQDVHLAGSPLAIPENVSLRFLSVVEVSRIPLYITTGAQYGVITADKATERWFSDILATSAAAEWWEGARPDSPLGILVGVEHAASLTDAHEPRVTELLFYASKHQQDGRRPLTSLPSSPSSRARNTKEQTTLIIHAIALSSDLLHTSIEDELTPPCSPCAEAEDVEAVFLPQPCFTQPEPVNEPPTRKRRSAADAFDEASERRRKARRRGGESVSAAAAPKAESQMPALQHRRSVSNSGPVPLQTRPLSRSPSIASSRPPTATASGPKKSSLSHVQSSVEPTSTETKNKDFISRIVMAGMRLYGLSQSKASNRKPSEAVASNAQAEEQRRNDEDFKLVYHQVYKGTAFAFRTSISEHSLHPFAEQVRETVDKLLAIFCNDPLATGLPGYGDEVTPGGRKAFGSAMGYEEKSPFLEVPGLGTIVATTPSLRASNGAAG